MLHRMRSFMLPAIPVSNPTNNPTVNHAGWARIRLLMAIGFLTSGILLNGQTSGNDVRPEPSPVLSVASKVLDENIHDTERKALIAGHAQFAADLMRSIVDDMEVGTTEEAARIPWLWEIAVVAANHNNSEVIARILDISLPRPEAAISDWQIAVVGGGLIYQFSKNGLDPATRIAEIVGRDELLQQRWSSLLKISKKLALNQKVSLGIRYDALRVYSLSNWDEVKGLFNDVFHSTEKSEKQSDIRMAALSAMTDVENEEVTQFLLDHFLVLNGQERVKACDVLTKNELRSKRLLQTVRQGAIDAKLLPTRVIRRLLEHDNLRVRRLAKQVLRT